jgi:hypothetical protein
MTAQGAGVGTDRPEGDGRSMATDQRLTPERLTDAQLSEYLVGFDVIHAAGIDPGDEGREMKSLVLEVIASRQELAALRAENEALRERNSTMGVELSNLYAAKDGQ